MKIKKKYQGILPENRILNTASNSQVDTYSCDYINGIVLYESSAGSLTNITLSDNISNYKYIEIYYSVSNSSYNDCRKIYVNNKTTTFVETLNTFFAVNGNQARMRAKVIQMIGNQITINNYIGYIINTDRTITIDTNDYITINKVIGYK